MLEQHTSIEGTDAMRVSVFTIGLALVITCGSVGCKSAPKMSWWKTAGKTEPGATTTASGAPQLPSEVAKQAAALASSDPVKITTPAVTLAPAAKVVAAGTAATGGTAPAYAAAITPAGNYPTTGVQGYLPTTSAAAKSTVASSVTTATAAASKALPYNPNAVPPAAAIASTPVAPAATSPVAAPTQTDRYGIPASDRYANAYPATTTPGSNATPANYPTTSAPATVASAPVATTQVTSSVPFASNPSSTTIGDRYATQPISSGSPVSTTVPNTTTAPVQTASAVASVQPYRPGGTSSYPGTSANYEVATRPGTTTTAPSSYPATGSAQYR